MVFDKYLDISVRIYDICAIANRVSVVTNLLANRIKNCGEFLKAETHEVYLRPIIFLDFI